MWLAAWTGGSRGPAGGRGLACADGEWGAGEGGGRGDAIAARVGGQGRGLKGSRRLAVSAAGVNGALGSVGGLRGGTLAGRKRGRMSSSRWCRCR